MTVLYRVFAAGMFALALVTSAGAPRAEAAPPHPGERPAHLEPRGGRNPGPPQVIAHAPRVIVHVPQAAPGAVHFGQPDPRQVAHQAPPGYLLLPQPPVVLPPISQIAQVHNRPLELNVGPALMPISAVAPVQFAAHSIVTIVSPASSATGGNPGTVVDQAARAAAHGASRQAPVPVQVSFASVPATSRQAFVPTVISFTSAPAATTTHPVQAGNGPTVMPVTRQIPNLPRLSIAGSARVSAAAPVLRRAAKLPAAIEGLARHVLPAPPRERQAPDADAPAMDEGPLVTNIDTGQALPVGSATPSPAGTGAHDGTSFAALLALLLLLGGSIPWIRGGTLSAVLRPPDLSYAPPVPPG